MQYFKKSTKIFQPTSGWDSDIRVECKINGGKSAGFCG